MKPFHRLLILFSAAGLSAGFVVRRAASPAPASGENPERAASGAGAETGAATTDAPAAKAFPIPRSTDTPESLGALDDKALYPRLALWLTDASEADIATFWAGYSEREGGTDREITKLIFINWTRLNPRGALAAGGDDWKTDVWWAWSCGDPQASFAAALASDSDTLNNVIDGIGEFHPEWLREHFHEIPESLRESAAAYSIKQRADDPDPLKTLKFMEENDRDDAPIALNALARKDPWAALDWVKDHVKIIDYGPDFLPPENESLKAVVATLAAERPDDLARIAAQTPSGEGKRIMEAALFANLLQSDPAAALEQAKATTVPRIAAERYAAIGLPLVETDPAQAYQIAKRLLTACPDPASLDATVEYPGGGDQVGMINSDVYEFLDSIIAKEPEKLMDCFTTIPEGGKVAKTFTRLAQEWADQDFSAYAEWVSRQTLPAVRNKGGAIIISRLGSEGQYVEALYWAMSMDNSERDHAADLLTNWHELDPVSALQWLASSNLPADRKAEIKSRLDEE